MAIGWWDAWGCLLWTLVREVLQPWRAAVGQCHEGPRSALVLMRGRHAGEDHAYSLADDFGNGWGEVPNAIGAFLNVMNVSLPSPIWMLLQDRNDVSCPDIESSWVMEVPKILQSSDLQDS